MKSNTDYNNATGEVGTLITVGFMPTGFKRLFDVVSICANTLPRPIVVQAGSLKDHPFFSHADVVVDFFSNEEMKAWAKAAKVIISHAGVGNVKLANEYGKIPILIPRKSSFGEHIDDHQIELANMLSSAKLASILPPEPTPQQICDLIERTSSGSICLGGTLEVQPPDIHLKGKVLAVSSVGGHRAELEKFLCDQSNAQIIRMTDEMCDEIKSGTVLRFPSCNKRRHVFIRLIQAMWFLNRNRDIGTIITTGAGVGAIFVLAAKLFGIKTYAIESMTRIKAPGLWFRLAGRISDHAYAYGWSEWVEGFPNVTRLKISVSNLSKGGSD